MTTTSVGSGSWGDRLVKCVSPQLARFTTVPIGTPARVLSFNSTTFNPSPLRKNDASGAKIGLGRSGAYVFLVDIVFHLAFTFWCFSLKALKLYDF
jgi:hypothetical protein